MGLLQLRRRLLEHGQENLKLITNLAQHPGKDTTLVRPLITTYFPALYSEKPQILVAEELWFHESHNIMRLVVTVCFQYIAPGISGI